MYFKKSRREKKELSYYNYIIYELLSILKILGSDEITTTSFIIITVNLNCHYIIVVRGTLLSSVCYCLRLIFSDFFI